MPKMTFGETGLSVEDVNDHFDWIGLDEDEVYPAVCEWWDTLTAQEQGKYIDTALHIAKQKVGWLEAAYRRLNPPAIRKLTKAKIEKILDPDKFKTKHLLERLRELNPEKTEADYSKLMREAVDNGMSAWTIHDMLISMETEWEYNWGDD